MAGNCGWPIALKEGFAPVWCCRITWKKRRRPESDFLLAFRLFQQRIRPSHRHGACLLWRKGGGIEGKLKPQPIYHRGKRDGRRPGTGRAHAAIRQQAFQVSAESRIAFAVAGGDNGFGLDQTTDRKSTRLNSNHSSASTHQS